MKPVKVKICGIRTKEEVEALNRLKPQFAGFVLAPSKRRVTFDTAAYLLKRLDPAITPVAVLVNAAVSEVEELLRHCPFKVLQLHGQETPDTLKALRTELNGLDREQGTAEATIGIQIWKALRADTPELLQSIRTYLPHTDGILLDGKAPGSGQSYDLTPIHGLAEKLGSIPLILAGGLHPENVGRAIAQIKPWAVDTSSGADGLDGYKDSERIKAFMAAAVQQ